jgi:hypothetical protein
MVIGYWLKIGAFMSAVAVMLQFGWPSSGMEAKTESQSFLSLLEQNRISLKEDGNTQFGYCKESGYIVFRMSKADQR